jgi:hypothetical protein
MTFIIHQHSYPNQLADHVGTSVIQIIYLILIDYFILTMRSNYLAGYIYHWNLSDKDTLSCVFNFDLLYSNKVFFKTQNLLNHMFIQMAQALYRLLYFTEIY